MTALLSTVTVIAADVLGAEAAPAGAPAAGQTAGPGGIASALFQLLPIILIVVVFFWLMNRSQRKRDRERQDMLSNIQPKDDVVTIGGIEGRVVRVDGDKVTLRIDADKDVKVTIVKSGISRKISQEEQK